MAKGVYIGITEEYQQLEYLESSGTQYINTGFTPNQDTRVVCTFEKIAQYDKAAAVFGSRYSKNNKDFTFWGFLSSTNSGIGGNYGSYNYTLGNPDFNKITVDANKNNISVNNGELTTQITAQTFTCVCPMFLFATNKNGTADTQMGAIRIFSCQIYNNGTLVRDFVPCRAPNGAIGMYDKVNEKLYQNSGSGSFLIGNKIGIIKSNQVAKKINNIYIGIDGIARKIKRAYIGVNGIAKMFLVTQKTLSYYGAPTVLSTARSKPAATSTKDYAIFAGGSDYNTTNAVYSVVDAYNKTLTRMAVAALTTPRCHIGAASNDNYAIFAGGRFDSVFTECSLVDAYDNQLTKIDTIDGLSFNGALIGGARVDNYMIFASKAASANAYDKYLTRTMIEGLRQDRPGCGAISFGKYALFGGGDSKNDLDVYDKSLTRFFVDDLSSHGINFSAAKVGAYALFAGGVNQGVYLDTVDVYDTYLTKMTSVKLASKKANMGAASLGDYALFAGGLAGANSTTATVDAYNINLTRTTPTSIGSRYDISGTSVGNYAIFAGGSWRNSSGGAKYSQTYAYIVR